MDTLSTEFYRNEAAHWKALYQAERDRVNRLRAALRSDFVNEEDAETLVVLRVDQDIEEWYEQLLPGDMSDNSSSETRKVE